MHPDLFASRGDNLVRSLSFGGVFLVAYLLLDQVSFIHHLQELNITPWNPQPALAIALIALYGRKWIVWVFVAVLSAEVVVRELRVPLETAVLLTGISTCGYAGIAWLLRGPLEIALDLSSRKDVLRLVAAVALGTGFMGVLYIGALSIRGYIAWSQYPHALFRFWVGDVLGILVTLPLLLFIADTRRRQELRRLAYQREILLQIGLVGAVLVFVFTKGESELLKYFYLLFFPIIWIAARHGLAGAIGAIAIIQAGIIVSVEASDHATLTVIQLQTRLLSLALTGLLLGVTVDEWRRVSDRLERAQQLTAAGEMATALAHELNQPLTALSMYADAIRLLAGKAPDNAPLVDTAERIRRVATRCADIVGRFRSLGTECANAKERILIGEPIRSAIDALHERTIRSGAVIDVSLPDDLPPIEIDRARMTFAFQNLVANALDAIGDLPPDTRRIGVAARLDGRTHIAITIRDSGHGIRPELADKIFEPFYSGKAQGMGLGLAISRSIVESHGGWLWAEPASHGIFHIRLSL